MFQEWKTFLLQARVEIFLPFSLARDLRRTEIRHLMKFKTDKNNHRRNMQRQ